MLDEALTLSRQIGDRLGEANVLNDIGMTHLYAHDDTSAIDFFERGLDLYEALDQPLGQAHAHAALVRALRRSGRNLDAVRHLEAMRDLYREIGNRLGESSTQVELGASLSPRSDGQPSDAADPERARSVLTEAVALYESIGNRIGAGNAHFELGRLSGTIGDLAAAREHLTAALTIFTTFGITRDVERVRGELRRLGLPDQHD
jgi:tetratricopeptide (TPR) repeat protein